MRKVIVRNLGILVAQYGITSLVPLLLVPHLVRTIGLEMYGEISIALGFATYAGLIVSYAFHITGPIYIAKTDTQAQQARIFAAIASAKALLFTGVASGSVIAVMLLPAELRSIYTVMIGFITFGAALNSTWFLYATDGYFSAALISVAAGATSLVVGLLFVSHSGVHGPMLAAVALTIAPLVVGIGTFVAAWREAGPKSRDIDFAESFRMLRTSGSLFLSQMTAALYSVSGPIIIGFFVNTTAAGAYSAVERVVTALTNMLLLIHVAAYPRLASLYGEDRRRYWRVLYFVVGLYLVAAFLVLVVGIMSKDSLLFAIFGKTVEDGALLLVWGLVWMILSIFGVVVTGLLTVSANRERVFPLTLKVLAVAMVVGIPGVSILGAYAWMAALAVSQLVVVFSAYRLWRERYRAMPGQSHV